MANLKEVNIILKKKKSEEYQQYDLIYIKIRNKNFKI